MLKNASDGKAPKEGSFLATVEGAKVTIIRYIPHFSALANVALEAVLTRFEDPENRTPKAEVSVFAVLAAWQIKIEVKI